VDGINTPTMVNWRQAEAWQNIENGSAGSSSSSDYRRVCRCALARKRGAPEGYWLERMLLRKPTMLVVVALANKIARIAWALMAHGGLYRTPARVA
jgi:hypothetical protein